MVQAVILLGTLEQQPMFAKMIAVIRGVYLHGIVRHTGFVDGLSDPADGIIDH